jgi:hypothetical protein
VKESFKVSIAIIGCLLCTLWCLDLSAKRGAPSVSETSKVGRAGTAGLSKQTAPQFSAKLHDIVEVGGFLDFLCNDYIVMCTNQKIIEYFQNNKNYYDLATADVNDCVHQTFASCSVCATENANQRVNAKLHYMNSQDSLMTYRCSTDPINYLERLQYETCPATNYPFNLTIRVRGDSTETNRVNVVVCQPPDPPVLATEAYVDRAVQYVLNGDTPECRVYSEEDGAVVATAKYQGGTVAVDRAVILQRVNYLGWITASSFLTARVKAVTVQRLDTNKYGCDVVLEQINNALLNPL